MCPTDLSLGPPELSLCHPDIHFFRHTPPGYYCPWCSSYFYLLVELWCVAMGTMFTGSNPICQRRSIRNVVLFAVRSPITSTSELPWRLLHSDGVLLGVVARWTPSFSTDHRMFGSLHKQVECIYLEKKGKGILLVAIRF